MLLAEGLKCADRDRFEFGYGYFLPWKSALADPIRREGVPVTCFGQRTRFGILRSARVVADAVRDWSADVVHCHLPLAGVVGSRVARRISVPIVYTEHNVLERYHWLTRALTVAAYADFDAAVAVSDEVATSIARRVRARTRVEVIENGIDTDTFSAHGRSKAEARRQIGMPEEASVIGTVAGFRRQKALGDWLDAAAMIRARDPRARFVVVGDGPLRGELEEHRGALGLDECVSFEGSQTDVRPFLRAMDVYMMSSVHEGLPLALLEAMSMGVPVVSTTAGGVPSVLREGVDGFLVAPGASQDLADRVVRLLGAPEERERLGMAGRERVRERFGMQRMQKRLEDLYRGVVHGHAE
jgi:glycosyltransferase involved in cell wall biosynthesis